MAPAQSQPVVATQQQDVARRSTREEQLAAALDRLMQEDPDIQAAALVSLDGFTMASALPEGMQPDRVGAMSAAILGLGERAAAELGRGHLSQVFIQGDSGYVLLMSVGERAVLTAMADANAKLGLVLYDMRAVADDIAGILG
ncbi:MAG: roadblock/LC7 domain-containing protein [Actinomycetota bacterium]|nr:roadblock/LC7 domain-containing protein [Actinomycetota bacterium]MDP3630699.1 roadblock/LC7 domain-containing protein [Actinomycetota bacterium]